MSTLVVNEIFGPTIQGEGKSAGRPAAFLRVAGCNLSCVWCDTPYSWDYTRFDKAQEVHKLDTWEAAQAVIKCLPAVPRNLRMDRFPLLVVSGGEPMLQQDALAEVLDLLPFVVLEVETAGTRKPLPIFDDWVNRYNVSLKLEHSGNDSRRLVPDAIAALNETRRAVWKFVVQEPRQLTEVDLMVESLGLEGDILIMPEGTTTDVLLERAQALTPGIIERGWSLTPRLHIELWGATRGH